MDMFTTIIVWTAICIGGGYAAGSVLPQTNLGIDCQNKGEMVISDKVFACNPTHVISDGKRIRLEQ